MPRNFLVACLSVLLPWAALAETAPAASSASASAKSEPAPAAPAGPKITYTACHVDGPYIAMTFDDGPSAANTPRLLDMLKERGIHATFFMVGENAIQYPQIIKRMIAEGHEVGNHSYTHPQLSKMSDEAVKQQLQKTQDAIVAGAGVTPVLMRPPYGAFTERQRRWCNGEFGYKIILWDVDPLDWKIRNSEHVQAEILKQTVAGSIILSHDIHKTTVDAMPTTLDALKAKGFKFVTVSQLIAMDHPAPPKAKKGETSAATESSPASKSESSAKSESTPAPAKASAPAETTPTPATAAAPEPRKNDR